MLDACAGWGPGWRSVLSRAVAVRRVGPAATETATGVREERGEGLHCRHGIDSEALP